MIGAALALARRGMAVFPLKPRGKLPLTLHGCKDATCDPERIEEWWTRWPNANIGVATGKASGIFVLDIDEADGEASIRAIEKEHARALPSTAKSITGRGRHLLFKLPSWDGAPEIRNSAGKVAPGIDIRGEGGYVVAPPSIHPSGRKYAWSVDSGNVIAEPPVWLINVIVPEPIELDRRRPTEHFRRIAKGAAEGCRNESAASLAGLLLRRGIDPEVALDLMVAWDQVYCTPPQGAEAILATVESILRKELKRRGVAI